MGVPSLRAALESEGVGQVRARCKGNEGAPPDLCVVEFDRVTQVRQVEIAKKLEKLGYRVVRNQTDQKGPKRYASDVWFRPTRSRPA